MKGTYNLLTQPHDPPIRAFGLRVRSNYQYLPASGDWYADPARPEYGFGVYYLIK